MQPATASRGLFLHRASRFTASSTARTDSRTAGAMKPQVLMKTRRARPIWLTLLTGKPKEPSRRSLSTRFLGQPRLRDQTGRAFVGVWMLIAA